MLIISITNWMKVKLWSTLIYCFDFVEGYDVTDFLVSIVVSIPACHAGDRGSIPRRGVKCIYSQSQTHSTWCYLRSMWCLWARRGSLLPSPIERNWSNDPLWYEVWNSLGWQSGVKNCVQVALSSGGVGSNLISDRTFEDTQRKIKQPSWWLSYFKGSAKLGLHAAASCSVRGELINNNNKRVHVSVENWSEISLH